MWMVLSIYGYVYFEHTRLQNNKIAIIPVQFFDHKKLDYISFWMVKKKIIPTLRKHYDWFIIFRYDSTQNGWGTFEKQIQGDEHLVKGNIYQFLKSVSTFNPKSHMVYDVIHLGHGGKIFYIYKIIENALKKINHKKKVIKLKSRVLFNSGCSDFQDLKNFKYIKKMQHPLLIFTNPHTTIGFFQMSQAVELFLNHNLKAKKVLKIVNHFEKKQWLNHFVQMVYEYQYEASSILYYMFKKTNSQSILQNSIQEITSRINFIEFTPEKPRLNHPVSLGDWFCVGLCSENNDSLTKISFDKE